MTWINPSRIQDDYRSKLLFPSFPNLSHRMSLLLHVSRECDRRTLGTSVLLSTRQCDTDIQVSSIFVSKITTKTYPSQLPCYKPKYLLTYTRVKTCYSPSSLENQNTDKPGNSDVNVSTLCVFKQHVLQLKTLKNSLP